MWPLVPPDLVWLDALSTSSDIGTAVREPVDIGIAASHEVMGSGERLFWDHYFRMPKTRTPYHPDFAAYSVNGLGFLV